MPEAIKVFSTASMPSPRTTKNLSLSQRQQLRQRRLLQEKLNEEPPAKLVKAFTETVMSSSLENTSSVSSNKASQEGLELIIYTCMDNPETAVDISKKIKAGSTDLKPYTPEEALALIIDFKLSVNTYKMMRQELNERGYQPYPPYYLVMQCKTMCYPKQNIEVTENEASVSLQALGDHTFERIIQTVDNS